MSAVLFRMVFGVTIAVVAAVVYVYSNRRTQNNPNAPHLSNRGGNDYEPRNRWEQEDDEKPRKRKSVKQTVAHDDVSDNSSEISGSSTDILKNCGICLESFEHLKELGIELHSTTCGHIFCISCLRESLKSNSQCPQCRKRVNPNQTLRIFL